MPKKRSPILPKVSNFLKISIFIAKMGKPIIPVLIFFKKTRKLKKFKLLKHYNYGFIEEYQFSPSNAPLINYYRKSLVKKRSFRYICSMFFVCRCLGSFRGGEGDGDYTLEALPAAIESAIVGELSEASDSCGEEDSVDERAERFIERFYEEMRMQRLESVLQLNEGLDMGCY